MKSSNNFRSMFGKFFSTFFACCGMKAKPDEPEEAPRAAAKPRCEPPIDGRELEESLQHGQLIPLWTRVLLEKMSTQTAGKIIIKNL